MGGLPLAAGGVSVDVSCDGGLDEIVVAAGVFEGAVDGHFGHFGVVWIVVGRLDECRHTDSHNINLLRHQNYIRFAD